MKQQILELKKKLLLVELKSDKQPIEHRGDFHTMNLIGKLTDITEHQFDELVERNEEGQYYKDYRKDGWQADIAAVESFFSYLESKEIYFENKIGERPKEEDFKLTGNSEQSWRMIEEDRGGQKPTWASIFARNYQDKFKLWQESQEKVFDINRCYLFEII